IVIHEGVNREKKRHTLINPMVFSSVESSQDAFKQAAHYLNQVYNLKDTIVVTNSDGGSGYEADKFESMDGYSKQHEHFRDLFHVHKKIKERLSFDKPMAKQVEKAIYQYDWDRIETLCATIESRLIDLPEVIIEDRLEQIRKLKNYLSRNWVYIKPFKKRELSIDRGTGAGETGHRLYTYRMKRQGRSWTKKGASHVVAILTAEKNGLLQTALTAEITDKVESLGEEIKGAVRQALKKIDSTAKQSKRVLSSIMVRKAAL
ncbi:ISLre2 family transposase, partial [Listeria monocytogenes]|nr:ISLre2 family transposase [Listeria monocytogenes]EAC6558884.1 ISLre2 family transposase [Listeria monocytogenes]EAD2671036.1 ISLre2 family transposase [Listeria monocytogenes]EAD5616390.1 ISLre2 family transposase [Listeria monocytogenes]EAF8266579.1 ISLre2 family transposase [Listeria monocytogenes]